MQRMLDYNMYSTKMKRTKMKRVVFPTMRVKARPYIRRAYRSTTTTGIISYYKITLRYYKIKLK